MSPSSAEDTGKCYKQPLFGPFAPSGSLESNGTARYGTYESFGPGTLSTEHAVRDDDPYKGYSETYSASWATGWNRPCLVSSRRSRYPFADKSRESQYTAANPSDSFSLCSPSRSRPAPIGSRGRDMHQNMQGNCCERGAVGSEDRQKAVTCSSQSPAFRIKTLLNYSNSAASVFQRPKRKMMEPVTLCKLAKKRRTVGAAPSLSRGVGPNISKDNCISPDNQEKDGQRVCVKKARASEKRRRRREKNNEKYGDKHRWAFTCAFCKFHTFEDKDIEKHFGSTYHREILDYIRRQAKFDDNVIRFLHDCMVHKFRKTVSTLHKLKSTCGRSKDEWTKIMEGVTEDDYMRRMEVVYCSACDTHIPVVFSSVQQHLCSLTHLKRKEAYKDQLKRDSVVTAKAIINNDNVKMRFEMYMKGEDPFSANLKDTSSDCLDQERFDEAEDEEADDDDSQEHERSDEAEDDDSQDQERSDDEARVTDS